MAETSAKKHTYPCSGCGASLTFEPGTHSLTCDYCGNEQKIETGAGTTQVTVQEYDFSAGLAKAKKQTKGEQGGKEVACDGCGARTVFETQASECPYCDSPVVVAQDDAEEVLVPESLLPFKVTHDQAGEAFRSWVTGLWFAPSDLAKKAIGEAINGVYMPYWSYDTNTTTDYSGERGDHYTETETYTDSEGNQQTREVQHTNWTSASGTVRVNFDDVLVCASKSLPLTLTRGLEPWDLGDLKPYDPAFLSGMGAERPQIDLDQGFKVAQGRMQPRIRTTIEGDIGGDEQRIHSMDTRYDDVTFKHFLLPLWISSFRYDQEVFRFTVNARTGLVTGERPYSWIKITLFVLFIIAIVIGIVALISMGGK